MTHAYVKLKSFLLLMKLKVKTRVCLRFLKSVKCANIQFHVDDFTYFPSSICSCKRIYSTPAFTLLIFIKSSFLRVFSATRMLDSI